MARIAWLTLLFAGLVLLLWGATTLDPSGAPFAIVFTGPTSPKAMVLLVGGFLVSLIGLAGSLRSSGS